MRGNRNESERNRNASGIKNPPTTHSRGTNLNLHPCQRLEAVGNVVVGSHGGLGLGAYPIVEGLLLGEALVEGSLADALGLDGVFLFTLMVINKEL